MGGVWEAWELAVGLLSLAFFCPVRLGTGLARFTPLSAAVVLEASEPEDPEQETSCGSSFPVPFWVTRSSFFLRDLFLFFVFPATPKLWLILGSSGLGCSAGSRIHGNGTPTCRPLSYRRQSQHVVRKGYILPWSTGEGHECI